MGSKKAGAAESNGCAVLALRWENRTVLLATTPGLGYSQMTSPRRKNFSVFFTGKRPTPIARSNLWVDLVDKLVGADSDRVYGKHIGVGVLVVVFLVGLF